MKIGYAVLLDNEAHNFIRQVQLELHETLGGALSKTISPYYRKIAIRYRFDPSTSGLSGRTGQGY